MTTLTTMVDVQQVRVPPHRVREKQHDPANLAESIAKHGLFHPITVRTDLTLIAGYHRLAAVKLLGWTEVAATIRDVDDVEAELIEIDENLEDLGLSAWEQSKHIARREALMQARGERATHGGDRKSSDHGEHLNERKTTADLAESAGMSSATWRRRAKVGRAISDEVAAVLDDIDPDSCSLPDSTTQLNYLAGIDDPNDQLEAATRVADGTARDVFDASKQIKREKKEAEREAQREENREKIQDTPSLDSLEATFSTIVVDPPWDWGDEGDQDQLGRARPDYATMSLDELKELPIADLADTDAHLYLWITNRSLPKGFQLLKAWDFRYITCLTWAKPHYGMGNYFRGQTEHILFGVRGSQPLKRKDVGTIFHAKRGEHGHSSKPTEFYELVESCSPGPYLDVFSRIDRADWTAWGENSG